MNFKSSSSLSAPRPSRSFGRRTSHAARWRLISVGRNQRVTSKTNQLNVSFGKFCAHSRPSEIGPVAVAGECLKYGSFRGVAPEHGTAAMLATSDIPPHQPRTTQKAAPAQSLALNFPRKPPARTSSPRPRRYPQRLSITGINEIFDCTSFQRTAAKEQM